MNRVLAIVRKEWAEVFRNRLVLTTFAVLPLTFLGLALVSFTGVHHVASISEQALEDVPEEFGAVCQGLGGVECAEAYMGTVFLLLFLLLPLLMPNSFAAYSVVGEKVSRTLEPLLATPIRTGELLLAKALAAIVPSLAATWLAVGLYAAMLFALPGPDVARLVLAPHWVLAVVVFAPLSSTFAALVALMVSSVAREPRTAEMVTGVVVTPFVLLIVGQIVGLLVVDGTLVLLACVVALAADLMLAWLAVLVFDRENILTRWR